MRMGLLLIFLLVFSAGYSQLLSWTPDFATDNDNLTITMDATKGNQGLLGYSGNVYVHVGVITNLSTGPTDWKHVKFTWGSTEAAALATPAGTNKWSYTIINIRSFFNVPGGEIILKVAILFRTGGCSDCQVQRNSNGSDMYLPVYGNDLYARFNQPLMQPLFIPQPEPINKMVGDPVSIAAVSSISSTINLYLNGLLIQSAANVTSLNYNHTLTDAGSQELIAEAVSGVMVKRDTIHFFAANTPVVMAMPAGMRFGINYEPGDTSVVLAIYAPGKGRVSVIGSFTGSNWMEQLPFQMNKTPDNNGWWIRITGLSPGQEYAFQYLVDGYLKVGEPYAEKILDPWNDNSIPAITYPGLLPYPSQTSGVVSVLQTAAPAYNWQVQNFLRPDKRGLVIYELLLRDYLQAHDWKTLRDTISYLKNLGVNAVELLPMNEFEGNISWGYNPDFYLAPDKYYGPKNMLKSFIDSCHKNGIAVIMDIALNHATGLCPLAALYWNNITNQPAVNNPWFNVTATHPFNVFNDFNHESLATNYFFSRVVEHWLNEYRIDGFRFDLSKGFTQFNSGNDVNLWSQYDASRVAIWKRYYDTLQLKSPGSYVILEHFAANNEEKELSDYGMMLWGNLSYNFQEASMGYVTTSNFESGVFTVRGWDHPHLVTYMESHDEERMMYKNLNFGNASGSYNIKNLATGLKRLEMSAAFLTMIPGPKMIWQFGETGYDYSINYCQDGSINNACRTDPKPIRWDYLQQTARKRLHDVYAALCKLRFHPLYRDGFLTNRISQNLAGAFKWLKLTTDTSNLCLVGNFDVNPATASVTFQNSGTWYDYLDGNTFTATGSSQSITLQPGEFHLYLNRNVTNIITTPVSDLNDPANTFRVSVYPNPVMAGTVIEIENKETGRGELRWINEAGQVLISKSLGVLTKGVHKFAVTETERQKLSAGIFMLQVRVKDRFITKKILIL